MSRKYGGTAGGGLPSRNQFVFIKQTPKFLANMLAGAPPQSSEPTIASKRPVEDDEDDGDAEEEGENAPVYVFAEDAKELEEEMKKPSEKTPATEESAESRFQSEEANKKDEPEEAEEEPSADGKIQFRQPNKKKASTAKKSANAKKTGSNLAAVKNQKLLSFGEDEL